MSGREELEKIKEKLKKSLKILLSVMLVCVIYKLNVIFTAICMGVAVIVNSMLLKESEQSRMHLKRFNDIVLYMEQIAYSFKKQPKIRQALMDAQKVCSEEIKEIIEEAAVNIDSKMTDRIYEESLKIIQDEYNCKRLRSLHEFIIKIEKHGGEYENYLNILLEDIKEWSDRTLLFIKNVGRVKRNVLISIGSTIVTCGFMAYLIPKEYSYTGHILYQVTSAVVITAMLGVYLLIEWKLNFDWIKEKEVLPDNIIIQYYLLVEKGYRDKKELSLLERISYKKAKRSLENEISKAFPDWVREVAINLQNDTVQSAIEESYENAALALKRPVRKLLIDFEKYPVGIEPYDNFLREFELPDIKSSIKMFYAINELGKEQSDKQVDSILDRNNKMAGQAEEMKNKDMVGTAGMLTAVPMVLGVIKIMTDMILMIIVFTSSVSSVMTG